MVGTERRAAIALVVLLGLAGCAGAEIESDAPFERPGSAGSGLGADVYIPLPEALPAGDAPYGDLGFQGRRDWAETILSLESSEPREPGVIGSLFGLSREVRLGGLVAGGVKGALGGPAGDAQAERALELGYATARRVVAAHPWLRDKRVAHIHPAILAHALREDDAERILRGSLLSGARERPAVWPPIDLSGRYSAFEARRIKRNAAQNLAVSDLPHWGIVLASWLRSSPDKVNLYLSSTPTSADIRHRVSRISYGRTGNDLSMARDTLAEVQIEYPGYAPCPIDPAYLDGKRDIFHCELTPLSERQIRAEGGVRREVRLSAEHAN